MKHILIPVDGSETSEHTIKMGVEVAKKFTEAKITLLYVLQNPEGEMMVNGSSLLQNAIEADKEKGLRMLNGYREEFGDMKDRVSCEVKMGPVVTVIRDYVGDADIDYIIMGSQGLGSAMKRFLVGSVTKKLLTMVDVPVLVVR